MRQQALYGFTDDELNNETSGEEQLASERHDLQRLTTDERQEAIKCRRCGLLITPGSVSPFEPCINTSERTTTEAEIGAGANGSLASAQDPQPTARVRTDGGMAVESTGRNTTLGEFVEDTPSSQYPCTNCDQVFDTGPALGGHLSYCRDDSNRPWTDPELLEELYHGEEDLSIQAIADQFDVDYRTIWNVFDAHDIERDEARQNHPGVPFETYRVRENRVRGYERWVHTAEDGSRQTVRIHRLAAVAWHDFDAVAGNDIHHDLPFQWLNVEWNLLPLNHGEHTRLEAQRRNGDETGDIPTPGYDWAGVEP